jgi:hypothetical protein
LDRLLDNYDPDVGYFELGLWRREARNLRKGLFGPKGLRDVPQGEGVRTFDLPRGWTLRLTYDVPPDDLTEPGNVVAEFIAPPMRRRGPVSKLRAEGSAPGFRAMKPNPVAHGAFWLQYAALHPEVRHVIAENLRPWCEHAAAAGEEIREALQAAVGGLG